MNGKNVSELALKTVEAVQKMGLAAHTAWSEYAHSYLPIVRMHQARGMQEFDRSIVTEYVQILERRIDRREISRLYYQNMRHGVERLTEMHDTGRLEWSGPKKVSRFVLNSYYETILTEFVPGEDVSPKAKSDITWIGRKYFAWLLWEGHADLKDVSADEIQRFVIYCSKHMTGGSVHNAMLYMKKLYRYLAGNGYAKENYSGLLSYKVSRGSKIFPALNKDEVELILELVDRHSPKGKRDYAIMLLGAVTGLRACDIAKMRLADIDWKKGEIKIVQSKTNQSLALPLTRDVGEAIQDYILNGRQQTTSDTLFLRVRPPCQGFANGVAIGYLYDRYRKQVGLPREARDGKGFHALRRSLGKNMVTSGVPVTTVAQVLGHNDIDSTKKYISLDSEHLKECALGFAGIEPQRRCHDE